MKMSLKEMRAGMNCFHNYLSSIMQRILIWSWLVGQWSVGYQYFLAKF